MRVIPMLVIPVVTVGLAGCAGLPHMSASPTDHAAVATPDHHPALRAPEVRRASAAPEPDEALAAAAAVTVPPQTAWERLRAGFAMPRPDHDRIEENLRYFADRPGYIARVAERAEPLVHYIIEAVEARDMPLELALLPVVESAYRPFAYSPGRAAGLWQFIPATGRHYGLEQNWWYDGRRDIVASTDAALTYLERLHGMFDDWLLALAAYNAGEGTVLRAIRANERRGRATDYWSLDLPRETRGYVPRLLAIREIFEQPDTYGVKLPHVPDEPFLKVVELDEQIDLALAADLAGLSIDALYRLNPGYNRWATAPEGPHRLILPTANAEHLRQGLAEVPADQRVHWQRHRVTRGESLISIARQYRTTVSVLKDVNGLRGHIIRAGDHLIIPIASRPSSHYALSASQRREALQNRDRPGRKQIYRVRSGDTFWEIARRFGVSVAQVTGWNGLAPGDTLRPGQELAIWTDEEPGGITTAALRTGPANRKQAVHYTVRSGDSLYRIAQRFKVSVAALRRWNGLSKGGYLQPGQRLRMEVDVTAQAGI